MNEENIDISPAEFEVAVKEILDAAAGGLVEYKSTHLEKLAGADGDYVIDVVARFVAFGQAEFTVLVECKHHARKVERQDVQVLHTKLVSLGAQKGMLFSSSGFQSGAIEYADSHGIALVWLVSGESTWFTKGAGERMPPPPWVRLPKYVGWWCKGSRQAVVSEDRPEYTRQALGFDPESN